MKGFVFLTLLALVFALLFVGSVACSASDTFPVWKKEPVTFLGLKFEAPLVGQIPACPASGMCFTMSRYRNDDAALENLPDLGIVGPVQTVEGAPKLSASLTISPEGNIGQIALSAARAVDWQMIDLAHKKYGDPQYVELNRSRRHIKFNVGKREREYILTSKIEHWYGKNILIELEYLNDEVPDCDKINSDYGTTEEGEGWFIRNCELMQEVHLTAESPAHVKREKLKKEDAERRHLDDL